MSILTLKAGWKRNSILFYTFVFINTPPVHQSNRRYNDPAAEHSFYLRGTIDCFSVSPLE